MRREGGRGKERAGSGEAERGQVQGRRGEGRFRGGGERAGSGEVGREQGQGRHRQGSNKRDVGRP